MVHIYFSFKYLSKWFRKIWKNFNWKWKCGQNWMEMFVRKWFHSFPRMDRGWGGIVCATIWAFFISLMRPELHWNWMGEWACVRHQLLWVPIKGMFGGAARFSNGKYTSHLIYAIAQGLKRIAYCSTVNGNCLFVSSYFKTFMIMLMWQIPFIA